jgi:hypothetical protein
VEPKINDWRQGKATEYGITLEVGSVEGSTEVRIIEAVYDRVGFNVTITDPDIPIPSSLQYWAA